MARRMNWSGVVTVSFRLEKTGTIRQLQLKTGSGHSLLDREALRAVRRASPFAGTGQEITVIVPIAFHLD